MSVNVSPQIKNKIWKEYTDDKKSKDELKQMFLGNSPTLAYKKISTKLKKKLDKESVKKSPSRPKNSPMRSKIKSKIVQQGKDKCNNLKK